MADGPDGLDTAASDEDALVEKTIASRARASQSVLELSPSQVRPIDDATARQLPALQLLVPAQIEAEPLPTSAAASRGRVDVHGDVPEATARALAAAEGLTLVPFRGSATGWKGVSPTGYGRFKVNVIGGKAYDSIFGAALAYARFRGPARSADEAENAEKTAAKYNQSIATRYGEQPEKPVQMSTEAVLAAACREGLTLEEHPPGRPFHSGGTRFVGVALGAAKDRP